MLPRLPEPGRVAARLQQVQVSRLYSNFGPQVRELEERYADFLGTSADRVVSVTNATLGIEGAIAVTDAEHWAVPSFTFAATPAAVLGAGRTLSWTDISASDWWTDVDAARLLPGSGAVAVAPFGTGFDLARWPEVWRSRELVIDAAASLGASLQPLGELPPTWAVVFSLHATKVLPAGEGGLVVFGDADRARAFRSWSNFGFDGRRESMRVGTNAKMSEISAAFALCSLEDWEQERVEWQKAHAMARRIETQLGLGTVPRTAEQLSPYWIVELESPEQTDRVENVLEQQGIGTRRWWFPTCHTMEGFRHLPVPPLPNTDDIAPRVLGLPMFRDLPAGDFDRIAAVIDSAL
jgi:dTDP-4-amino-4,6-dideoxygalactose transaminase